MADEGVRIEGLTKVVRALKDIGVEVDDLKDAFSAIAREAADRAARHAPRVSGRLAGGIRGNRAQSKAVVIAGRSSIPYAGAINYGWPARNIAASSFMQKADDEMRDRSVELLEDGINTAIRKRGLA